MAEFLKLNGIAVPVLDGSAGLDADVLGKTERVVDASIVSHRRAVKGVWEFSIAHQVAATALAFRDLLLGKGHYWSFDSHLYSAKGLAPSTVGGLTSSATNKKFGAQGGRIASGGSDAVFTNVWPSGSRWTLMWWEAQGDAGAFTHKLVLSTNTGAEYQNASFLPTPTDNVTFQSTGFTLKANGANRYFDDLVALPFVIPVDWISQIYNYGSAFSPLTKLYAAGDLLEANTKTVTCLGEFNGADLVQGRVGGVFYQSLHVVKGTLREV